MRCESVGCRLEATWEVGKEDRRKNVCRKCRDELIAVFGWEFRRSLYNKHREGEGVMDWFRRPLSTRWLWLAFVAVLLAAITESI